MNTINNVCSNCDSNNHCAMQTDNSAVLFCEEHQVANNTSDYTKLPTDNKSGGMVFFGLCSTCDFVNECTLKSQESIILNCEHYQ